MKVRWKIKIVLCSILLFATEGMPLANQETHKDIISKAKNLSLQKDRLQATKILIRAAQKEKGAARKEIILALQELSEIFYTEKGQQLFELGQTLKYTAPPTSIERLQDALQLEPSNVEILKALSRLQLNQGACEKAYELIQLLYEANPFEDEHVLLKLQASHCMNVKDQVKLILDSSEQRRSEVKIHFDLMRAQVLLDDGKLVAAETLLEKIQNADKKFPETYYWHSQAKRLQKKDFQDLARGYLALCKNISVETKNKYRFEPKICLEERHIEAELEELKNKSVAGD